jgi:hypothetical protein
MPNDAIRGIGMDVVKRTNAKGRVTLGRRFAKRAVIDAARRGLADVRAGRIGKGPNLKAAARLARTIGDGQG